MKSFRAVLISTLLALGPAWANAEASRGSALVPVTEAPSAVEFPVLAEGRQNGFHWRLHRLGNGAVLIALEEREGRHYVGAVKLPTATDEGDPALRDGDGWVLSPISVDAGGYGLYGLSYNGTPVALITRNRDGTYTIHAL